MKRSLKDWLFACHLRVTCVSLVGHCLVRFLKWPLSTFSLTDLFLTLSRKHKQGHKESSGICLYLYIFYICSIIVYYIVSIMSSESLNNSYHDVLPDPDPRPNPRIPAAAGLCLLWDLHSGISSSLLRLWPPCCEEQLGEVRYVPGCQCNCGYYTQSEAGQHWFLSNWWVLLNSIKVQNICTSSKSNLEYSRITIIHFKVSLHWVTDKGKAISREFAPSPGLLSMLSFWSRWCSMART